MNIARKSACYPDGRCDPPEPVTCQPPAYRDVNTNTCVLPPPKPIVCQHPQYWNVQAQACVYPNELPPVIPPTMCHLTVSWVSNNPVGTADPAILNKGDCGSTAELALVIALALLKGAFFK